MWFYLFYTPAAGTRYPFILGVLLRFHPLKLNQKHIFLSVPFSGLRAGFNYLVLFDFILTFFDGFNSCLINLCIF